MTQHCTITGTMLVPVHYSICTLKKKKFPEITVFVVVKINLFSVSVSVSIKKHSSVNVRLMLTNILRQKVGNSSERSQNVPS